MRKIHHKLVRDFIPKILREKGTSFELRTLSEQEYGRALRMKILEEAQEVFEASQSEICKEIADLLEVVAAFQASQGVSDDAVTEMRERLLHQRGGFERRLELLWTDDVAPLHESQTPHMTPLVELANTIRRERDLGREVPYADSNDGGVNAKLLILLEAPGPKAVASGFISMDNSDPTAVNLRGFLERAAIPRSAVMLWNVVPWFLGAPGGKKIRPASATDLQEAEKYLGHLLQQLSKLRAVLLLGRNAQRGWDKLRISSTVPAFRTYHTSAQVFAAVPSRKKEVSQVFREVATALYAE